MVSPATLGLAVGFPAVFKSHNTAPVWACRPTTKPSWVPTSTVLPATVPRRRNHHVEGGMPPFDTSRGVQGHNLPRGSRDIDGVVGNGRGMSDVASDASRPHAALLDRRGRAHTPEVQVSLPKQQRPLPWVGRGLPSDGPH